MLPVYIHSQDAGLRARWRELLSARGRDVLVFGQPGAHRPAQPAAGLWDLGAQPLGRLPDPQDLAQLDPRLFWVVMTARPEAAQGLAWLRGGARGYCNRLASADVLAAVLDTVQSGRVWAGREVNDHLLALALTPGESGTAGATPHLDALTPRELAIARQVAEGHSNKAIAIDAGISERTVKAHLNAIYRKTGLRNRVQLALALSGESDSRLRQSNG